MTTKLNDSTLEWAAEWIEGSLKGEPNERVREWGRNIATTLRAAKIDSRAPVAATSAEDILRRPRVMEGFDRYALGESIRRSFLKHGHGAWLSIAADVLAESPKWLAAVPVAATPQTYADGFCPQCSELAYPLTRALEATGVPTGETNWQQDYGPNKVRAMDDHESCLRQLLLALKEGKPEDVTARIERSEFSIEFHAAIRRKMTE